MINNSTDLQIQLNNDIGKISNKFLDYKIIGRTSQRRRMDIVIIGKLIDPKLKIFIMAGQHGDEKISRNANEQLTSHLIKTKAKEYPDVSIAVLSNANPDGAANNTRRTAEKIDMNRDHILLKSKENRFIHSFIKSWKPNLIIDVHTYPPTREYLKDKNYVFYQDVLIDSPNNLGVRRRLDTGELDRLIKCIQSSLDPHKYSCDRYVLIEPDGKIRHSTFDIVDARNFLSLRYDVLTMLVEGREPLHDEDKKIKTQNTLLALYHGLLAIIKWAINNSAILTNDSNLLSSSPGDKVAIRFKYNVPDKKYKINFENKLTKRIEEEHFSNYVYSQTPIRMVRIPYAYAIPIKKKKVINLLHRHGFISERNTESELSIIQKYMVLSLNSNNTKGKRRPPTKVRLIATEEETNLTDYEIFLTGQEGGHTLPFLLEPQSEYGFPRYRELNLRIEPGDIYPIIRVIRKKETKENINTETKENITIFNRSSALPIKNVG
jgi:hypothetical protein